MVYHARPSLTKMSIDDMSWAMQTLVNAGMEVTGMVIGDSYNIARFCEVRGIRHEMFENRPVADKFTYAWLRAVQQRCDYICWYGSNNVHHAGYWDVAIEKLQGKKVATFGTRNCIIMSSDESEEYGCLFHPTPGYLISSGQFFLTSALIKTVNLLTLYDYDQTFNFDGMILDQLTERWGEDIVEVITFDDEDCIDIKNEVNIHSFESYMAVDAYEKIPVKEIPGRHPCLSLFYNRFYD
jgi:hypothetical protein